MAADRVTELAKRLIKAAQPFLSGNVVDETTGTIPLMADLSDAIDELEAEIEAAALKALEERGD